MLKRHCLFWMMILEHKPSFYRHTNTNSKFAKGFEEERRILNAIEENQSVKTISEIYLRLYFIPKLQQNAVFEEMRSHLQHEEDAMKIIQTLWKIKEIKRKLKDLHLHRNTLLYSLTKWKNKSVLIYVIYINYS